MTDVCGDDGTADSDAQSSDSSESEQSLSLTQSEVDEEEDEEEEEKNWVFTQATGSLLGVWARLRFSRFMLIC